MNPVRKKRLIIVLAIAAGVGAMVGLTLSVLQQGINLFYTPTQIANGEAPTDTHIHVGGLAEKDSLQRSEDSLNAHFVVTDGAKEVTITYHGIPPDLFREGQDIVVLGKLDGDGVLAADEVLVKHDEDYAPPEVTKVLKDSSQLKRYKDGKAVDETSYNQGGEWTIPRLGHLALILTLCLVLVQSNLPPVGAWRDDRQWMSLAHPTAWGQFVLLAFALGCLTWVFLHDDFSIVHVAGNSSSALPWCCKFSAVWGVHEGSLLLWVLVPGGWISAASISSRQLPEVTLVRVLAVMGMISTGLLLFLTITSNPSSRLLPQTPMGGDDFSPLLQDVGLIVHPPMFYMGYIGFSVAPAFAIATLLGGRLGTTWVCRLRPRTLVAWAFLGIGIVFGFWWAYHELGWGGWWFWDPVENAPFVPWLVDTTLVHSPAVTGKRGVSKSWTVLLAIAAFSLSPLGTLLIRPGVFTLVHAFASNPECGVFILAFLLLVIDGLLTLFALCTPVIKSQVGFALWPRKTLLLPNSPVLVVATSMILLGALCPLLPDTLSDAKLSVGSPYFNAMFLLLVAVLMMALAVDVLVHWKDAPSRWLPGMLTLVLAASAVPAVVGSMYFDGFSQVVLAVLLLSVWVVLADFRDFLDKTRHKGALASARSLTHSY